MRLHNTLVKVLGQHENWLDIRHLYTLAWMMVGLIKSECVNLTAWIPYTISELKPDIKICVIFLAKYIINSLYQVWI